MSECSHACGGTCCRRFPLSSSPEHLAGLYAGLVARRDAGHELCENDRDIIMIAEMVIPLAKESDEQPTYTCKHFDPVAGLCLAYDARPRMCRDYPSYGDPGRKCEHCGFTQTPAEPELVQLKAAS
jgi:Fe-S-cluster containining protein